MQKLAAAAKYSTVLPGDVFRAHILILDCLKTQTTTGCCTAKQARPTLVKRRPFMLSTHMKAGGRVGRGPCTPRLAAKGHGTQPDREAQVIKGMHLTSDDQSSSCLNQGRALPAPAARAQSAHWKMKRRPLMPSTQTTSTSRDRNSSRLNMNQVSQALVAW